jgi:hypothetical protein
MATGPLSEADYRSLSETVASLEQRVTSIETRRDATGRRDSATPDIEGLKDDIIRITQEFFPGPVSIELMNDPEYPDDSFHVVQAEATGDIRDIVARRLNWHRRIGELAPGLVLPISLANRQ